MAQTSAQVQEAAIRPVAKVQDAQAEERHFRWHHAILYVFIVIFTITSIGPLIFTFISSFKTFGEVLAFPPSLIPRVWTWGNYSQLFANPDILQWVLNTFIYAVGATILNVIFSAMAGYALSRMNFPGKEIIFVITLSVMMIPLAVTLIPKFLVMNGLGLANTYWALILPAMAQPLSVFIMIQFMKGLPKELEESATIDGASRLRIFASIIVPLVKPALTAVAIVTFQGAWNDFQWPLVVLNAQNMYTLPVGLLLFKNGHYTEYNLLLTGSMFNVIPILILFFIFQRYFIEGATASGIKG